MKAIKTQGNYVSYLMRLSFVIVLGLAIAFISVLVKFSIDQNVDNRVFAELESTSETQKSVLLSRMRVQYQPLNIVAELIKDGESFASEQMQPTLRALVQAHTLCMLGFADLDGNTTDYESNLFGNIHDRSYFLDIISGKSEQCCEYLATTKALNEPRVLFSIPAYDGNGNLLGVLFCSKEIDVLEEVLFKRSNLFDSSSNVFVCNTDGSVIVATEGVYENLITDEETSVFATVPALKEMQNQGKNVEKIIVNGSSAYASLEPLQINDWLLGCVVDQSTAAKAYAENLNNIRNLALSVSAIFVVALGYIILLLTIDFYRRKREIQTIRRYYQNYKALLHELNCTVVEYDTENASLQVVEDFNDAFGISEWADSENGYEQISMLHPEFDFHELETEVELVQKNRQAYSFESIVKVNDSSRWVKIILIPVLTEERTLNVLGVALDITNMHRDFEAIVETFTQVPGGICRCRLDEPMHLEYFSEGLCKMLGYTEKEMQEIIGKGNDYSRLVYAEDRPQFDRFMLNSAEHGGTLTCEYRMICKDGSLLSVSDTMEAKRTTSGIMYGYCVVTDLENYKKVQSELEQELAITKEYLEQLKIKNFTSQMQPHFLYNALASIREIVLDDPEYASELIYDFTTHLRACLRSVASDTLISFQQELTNINAYVNIEKMRFGSKLSVVYDCAEVNFSVIPLSVQPLVENAIRHGIYERGSVGGTVVVRSFQTETGIVVQVEDDGIGFDFDKTMQEIREGTRDSTGLFNLIFRFEKVMHAHVVVESQLNIGTKITVEIPSEGKVQ